MRIFIRNTSLAIAFSTALLLHVNAQTARSKASANSRIDPATGVPVNPPPDGIAPEAPLDVTTETVNNVVVERDEDDRLVREMFPNQGDFILKSDWNGASGESPTMVVRTSKPDAKNDGLEEDLLVMHRILEKAIGRNSEGNARGHAMGIQLFTFNGSRAPRSIYLEGYGALFLLDTQIPLLPPGEKTENPKPKDSDSTWEETKDELYGDDQPYRKSSRHRFGDDASEPYDAAKVEELKDSILKALANASNIRGLVDERVVVVVSNRSQGESKDRLRVITAPGGGFGMSGPGPGKAGNFGRVDVIRGRSTKPRGANVAEKPEARMTIEVRKSDVEQFAKKNMEFEEFKKKAKITIY